MTDQKLNFLLEKSLLEWKRELLVGTKDGRASKIKILDI